MPLHYDDMNPDVRVRKLRYIRERIANGEKLTIEEENLYSKSKRKRWF